MSSDTTQLLKKGATQIRFYSPVILKGTLLVSGAALGVMMKTLLDWKAQVAQGIPISEFDLRILWVAVAYASVLQWIGYIDQTVARHSDKRDERDKQRDATTPPIPPKSETRKLTTLG